MSYMETARLVPVYCPKEGNKEGGGSLSLSLSLSPEQIQKNWEWSFSELFPHADAF